MKKRAARALLFLGLILGICVAGYVALAVYYSGGFSFHTWINGVYCTGKTVEEVNKELLEGWEPPVFTVVDGEGKAYEISLSEAGYTADFTEPLSRYMEKQNPFLWAANFLPGKLPAGSFSGDSSLHPHADFSRELLERVWEELPFVKEEKSRERTLRIQLTEEGYQLIDGLSGRLDMEAGFQAMSLAAAEGDTSLNLVDSGCYVDIAPDADQQAVLELWEKIDRFQNTGIVYDMGDKQVPVDASVTWQFLSVREDGSMLLDENGELLLRKEGIEEFINDLAEEYNTYGKERQFTATRGDVVTIKGGTYGTRLDEAAETEYLTQAFLEKRQEIHVPEYRQEGFTRGKDDIGDTYIEVDMTEQKLYYYQDGECLVETSVVTGNISNHKTPAGVNYVYSKQTNRVLRGPGYASPVKYWMPVKGGIGIHDADWRSKFGGEIYKKNGSHGCINVPKEVMGGLYDNVELGTPVIMFY